MVESWESEALLMQMPVKISSTKSRVFIPTIKVIILELMCICANCICCVNSLQEIAIVYHPQPSARDKFLFLGNAPNQGVQGYDISMCQLDNLMKRTRVPWKLFFQYILSFWSWASHVTWLKQFSDEAQSVQQAEGSLQNKFSVKVGNLAHGGGEGVVLTQSQLLQITVFMAYLTLFCQKFPKNSRKKSQCTGSEGRVKPVGPNSQLLPKICFASFP